MTLLNIGFRRPSLFSAIATFAVSFLAAVFVIRRIRLYFTDDVLLKDSARLYTVRLQRSEEVTHNVRLLRFALHHSYQRLGLRVGEYISLRAVARDRMVVRHYTPVSLCHKRGSFDLIVKVYKAGTTKRFQYGGIMSQHLNSLMPGDEVMVQGPRGQLVYEGRGRFTEIDGHDLPPVNAIGMIGAGSGVTPMLQLVRHVFDDSSDNTHIWMIDVNTSERDIIARDELDQYARRYPYNFKIRHVLNEVPCEDDTAGIIQGPLNRDIIQAYLPPPTSEVMVLCCGPPELMDKVCRPALREIGYESAQVHIF